MFNIVHIKLANGDEIFANLENVDDTHITITDALVMEIVSSEDSIKYMFMTRYCPYNLVQMIQIDRRQVIHYGPVNEEIDEHYYQSLEFCRTSSDVKFKKGISEATKYLKRALVSLSTYNEPVDEINEGMDYFPGNSTKH